MNKVISFRILILDDEKEKYIVKDELEKLNTIPPEDYQLNIKGRKFSCLYFPQYSLEIVICQSIFSAKNSLLDERFDLVLVDIDFAKDKDFLIQIALQEQYRKIPSLGGLLLAIPFSKNLYTSIMVFTAKDGELRNQGDGLYSPDYVFLSELAEKGYLGNLTFLKLSDCQNEKSIHQPIGRAFYDSDNPYSWCKKVLPLLKPTPLSAINCVRYLQNNWREDQPPKLEFRVSRGERISNYISVALIEELILSSDENRIKLTEIISLLCKFSCGHAFSKNIYELAHVHRPENRNNLVQIIQGRYHNKEKQETFDRLLPELYQYFGSEDVFELSGYSNLDNFKIALQSLNNEQLERRFRINLLELANLVINNQQESCGPKVIYLYGLFGNPEEYRQGLKNVLEGLLISKEYIDNAEQNLFIEVTNIDADNKAGSQSATVSQTIKIWGNRKEETNLRDFDLLSSGGDYGDLRRYLNLLAGEIIIVGTNHDPTSGRFNAYSIKNCCSNDEIDGIEQIPRQESLTLYLKIYAQGFEL